MTGQAIDERTALLFNKAVDGQLTPDEATEWAELLGRRPDLADELADVREVKSITDGLRDRIRLDADIEPPRESAATRRWLGWGFVLMLFGALVLMAYGLVEWLTDPSVPMLVKLAVSATGAGALMLLGYVVRVRLRSWRDDPYRHIDL